MMIRLTIGDQAVLIGSVLGIVAAGVCAIYSRRAFLAGGSYFRFLLGCSLGGAAGGLVAGAGVAIVRVLPPLPY